MSRRVDIFKFTGKGDPVWVEDAESLSAAMKRAYALCEGHRDARYMVYSHETDEKIFISGDGPIKYDDPGFRSPQSA